MSVPDDMPARVRAAARWKYRFTGLPVDPTDEVQKFFSTGPHRDLIGRSIASMPSGEPSSMRIRIEDASAYGNVDPGGTAVPAGVTAFAEGAPPPRDVVVGVNGRIAAVARTVRWEDRTRLDALFWPGFLRSGRNEVALYELDGRRLRPIRLSS